LPFQSLFASIIELAFSFPDKPANYPQKNHRDLKFYKRMKNPFSVGNFPYISIPKKKSFQ